jgi:nucleoside-diphosphate-sugar epimerase
MKKVLITGALGQIGTDLSEALVNKIGTENVISCYHHKKPEIMDGSRGIYEQLDATKAGEIDKLIEKHQIDTVVHMASLLSANAEKQPMFAWEVNMNGLINVLEAAKKYQCAVFNPSSIAVLVPLLLRMILPRILF